MILLLSVSTGRSFFSVDEESGTYDSLTTLSRCSAAEKESLISAILNLEKEGYKRRIDSDIAWTGDFHGVGRIHEDPHFAWIVEQVETHTLKYLEELGIDLSKIDFIKEDLEYSILSVVVN